jgi:hypothetical protein
VIRINSIEKLNILKCLLGNFTFNGVKKAFPFVQWLYKGLKFWKFHDALNNIDKFDTLIQLPEITEENMYVHNPKGHELNLKYNPAIHTPLIV